MKLPCYHQTWKRFNIGFDQGWCCTSCKQEQINPYCNCGFEAKWKIVDGFTIFSCKFGECGYSKWYRCLEDFDERLS